MAPEPPPDAAHRAAYHEARAALAAIAGHEDRRIVAETFAHVPAV
jgi:hypothetical protein